MKTTHIESTGDEDRLTDGSNWMLMTRNDGLLRACPSNLPNASADDLRVPLWTDQYSNLFRLIVIH